MDNPITVRRMKEMLKGKLDDDMIWKFNAEYGEFFPLDEEYTKIQRFKP